MIVYYALAKASLPGEFRESPLMANELFTIYSVNERGTLLGEEKESMVMIRCGMKILKEIECETCIKLI